MPYNQILVGVMAGPSIVYPASKTSLVYTGGVQTYVVPAGVTRVRCKVWGAGGGGIAGFPTRLGGAGGFTEGEIAVTPGETLSIVVGQGGYAATGSGTAGTYGGGGGTPVQDSAGGGRSAIRRGSADLLCAGGGGGQGSGGNGAPGGGTSGGVATGAFPGGSGTQSAGGVAPGTGTNGSALQGGTGGSAGAGGGGGGGKYGGGGGGGGGGASGGGGGGSGDITGCVTDGSQSVTASTVAGTGATPPRTGDTDYAASIGIGGSLSAGGNGRVVIY